MHFTFISPEELRVPNTSATIFRKGRSLSGSGTTGICDRQFRCSVYDPRTKRTVFNEEDYVRLKDSYILDREKLRHAKDDLTVLHPLPRVNEIAVEVDDDPRACYFEQVRYGVFARMALIMKLLGV